LVMAGLQKRRKYILKNLVKIILSLCYGGRQLYITCTYEIQMGLDLILKQWLLGSLAMIIKCVSD
jgi:hypothetical protein